ncbi:MAG: right-handed parallel beta-helix repeat-containing protein [Thermoplasmatota archaeon]
MGTRLEHALILLITISSMAAVLGTIDAEVEEPNYFSGAIKIEGRNISVPEGFETTGSGTLEDPLIIGPVWLNNTDGPAISVRNSSAHIIIRSAAATFGIWNRSDGIFVANSTNVTLVDCYVQNCYIGLHIDNSTGVQAVGCDLSGNRYGVLARKSPLTSIRDCSMNGNLIDGVLMEDSANCTLSYCQLISNSARISNDAAVRAVRSSGFIVQGCEIRMNYGTGIFFQGPMADSIAMDCDINYNNEGLILSDCRHARVQGIELIINMKAMVLEGLRHCTFSDSFVYRNGEGILLNSVEESYFSRMEFLECGYGLDVRDSHSNMFDNNSFEGTRSFDIVLGDPDDETLSSDHNVLIGNLFQKDSKVLPSVHDHGTGNIWDLDGSGNTWSGSQLVDEDADEVGDQPFRINGTAGSADHFPRTDFLKEPEGGENTPDTEKVEDNKEGQLLVLFVAVLVAVLLLMLLTLVTGARDGR